MLKILQDRLQQYMNHELPDVQAGFSKVRGTRDQIANNHWIIEKAREFQKNIYFCFTEYMKALIMWISTNYGKFLKWLEYQTTLPVSWETCMQVKKQQWEPYMEQWTGSNLGKENVKAVYCHPAYLIFLQSTSSKIGRLDESQAGIKIAGRNTNNFRYVDDTNGRKWRGTKESLDEGEREEWKSWLKTQHSKN